MGRVRTLCHPEGMTNNSKCPSCGDNKRGIISNQEGIKQKGTARGVCLTCDASLERKEGETEWRLRR